MGDIDAEFALFENEIAELETAAPGEVRRQLPPVLRARAHARGRLMRVRRQTPPDLQAAPEDVGV